MTDNDAADNDAAAKESRKQLRRDRISSRLNGNDTFLKTESVKANPKSQFTNSNAQISTSFQRLNNIQAKSSQLVTDARVKIDRCEAKRRDAEAEDNAKRDHLLQQHVGSDSSTTAQRQQDDKVASGWEQCLTATNVQDLSKLLDRQQQVCDTSDVTWHGGGSSVAAASKSSNNKANEVKTKCDEFGLRLENNNHHNFGRSDEWNQAEKLIKSILTRREGLKSEVAIMEEKNLKLEQELESKLKEKINENLAFPPTKILSVGGDKDDPKK